MNLIDDEFEPKKKKTSKTTKIILAAIIVVVIAIVAIVVALVYIDANTLKLSINGVQNDKVRSMMDIDSDGTVYFPIKDIASYLGYQSFSGDYTDKSEEQNKCYVTDNSEVANFSLNSNKIYKLLITDNSSGNYDYYYAKKPVKAKNGVLYASSDAIEDAFNISFNYDVDSKRVTIYTMPYLINAYSSKVLDYGYEKISDDYNNQKTVLNDMLVVTKDQDKTYAVIDVKGQAVIEPKYEKIEYLPYSGDFLVTSNNKVGIISSDRKTKVQIQYDDLELIDTDASLYLAKKDDKYGVINSNEKPIVYIEYDQIGIDNTKFTQNNIKNKYLLDNGMIPVEKDDKWGAFDKNGKQVLNLDYDSFGYVASSSKDAVNLLIIPDYNDMVVCKDKKYGLVNSVGETVVNVVADDIYMVISSGEKKYYVSYNDKTYEVSELLGPYEPTKNKSGNTANEESDSNETTNENKNEQTSDQTDKKDEEQTQEDTEEQQNPDEEPEEQVEQPEEQPAEQVDEQPAEEVQTE